jgi:alkanesulfonate monooxygenase SsuD/methylene tetrahydromethanopterin reductase-like flavin-dependent oxidoreductase (luciferase family)
VHPTPLQKPHPPIWGATSSLEGHYEIGRHGIGLLSFTVGMPPENLEERIVNYRKGLAECKEPVGKFVNNTAATFTMVHCSDTNDKARAVAEESFVWYPKTAGRSIASLAEWMESRGQDLGNYAYAGEARKGDEAGFFDHITMDYLYDSGAGIVGDPDRCVELCKRYEAVGCELLFCLLNPYNIPHEEVMHSIELLGKHVIPELDK